MGRGVWFRPEWLLDPETAIREGWAEHRVCRWCGGRVDPPKRAWCSRLCVESYGFLSNWRMARRFIWERDGGRCVLCGAKVPLHGGRYWDSLSWSMVDRGAPAEIDHIIEVADGGTDAPSNLRTLCHDCHAAKTALAARDRRDRERGQGGLFGEAA